MTAATVAEAGIPPAVERLIAAHIHSVEQLEVLLLLRRDDRAWTAEEVARELSTNADSAMARLRDLTARGLAVVDDAMAGSFRYRRGPDDRTVSDLAECYAKRRVRVISMIFAKPPDGVQSFADAFRLRGDD